MAFSSIASACVQGLHIEVIHAESDVSNGLPMFHMVGYLSSEVKEAAERVRTAIRNSGFSLPPKKIVVNLSPATVKKKGASYDLPIALSVLEAVGNIPAKALERVLVAGVLHVEACDGAVIHFDVERYPIVIRRQCRQRKRRQQQAQRANQS